MTPSDINRTIREICDGLYVRRQEMLAAKGTDRESKPFTLSFDPRVTSYSEMRTILDAVRNTFPQWTIKAEWKQ